MEIDNYINCCGIREISGLSHHKTPECALRSFGEIYGRDSIYGVSRDRFRYALFSQAGRSKYGERFKNFILENKLGDVIETVGRHINPNSGHVLKAYIWTINHEAVKAYLKREASTERPDRG